MMPSENSNLNKQIIFKMENQKKSNQLIKIITDSGLEKSKADVLLAQFAEYESLAAEWETKAKSIIITDESQVALMVQAGEARKIMKTKRVEIEKRRKELKESALKEGQAIDAVARFLTALITPIELELESKEKYIEIKAKERRDKLQDERSILVAPYTEFVPFGVDLGAMTQEDFDKLFNGLKLQQEDKVKRQAEEEKRQAEEKRVNDLKLAREKEISLMWAFVPEEMKSSNFGLMDEKTWQKLIDGTRKAKEVNDKAFEKLQNQNKKLQSQIKNTSTPVVDLSSKNDEDKWKLMIAECEAMKEKYEFDSEIFQNYWKGLNVSMDKIILWAKSKV